jgi:hypothetical protein
VAGVVRVRRAGGSVPLAVLALLLTVPPVLGAGERDTSAGVVLARGGVSAGLVADLDGDGGNEVLAVIYPADGTGPLILQAWAERDGTWSSLGRVPLRRWDDGDDQPHAARGTDAASVMAVRTAAGLQVLVPVVAMGREVPGGCCLSFSTVRLGPEGLLVDLGPRLPGTNAAESLVAVDVEADGLDELVVTEYVPITADQSYEPRYYLLRQTASGWRRATLPVEQDGGPYLSAIGETDGVRGQDLIFQDAETNGMARVFSDGGELRTEHAPAAALFDRNGGWIAAAIDGLLVLSDGSGIATAEWPRGGAPARLRLTDTGVHPTVFVLGDGPDARIVEMTDNGMAQDAPLGLRVYDLELQLERSVVARPAVQRLWELSTTGQSTLDEVSYRLWPQFGPIPGGLGGRPAMLGAGALVSVSPDGTVEVSEARAIVGSSPVGMAGRSSDWVVNGPGWFGLSTSVSLYGGFVPEAVVSVVPLETMLQPDAGTEAWDLNRATPVVVDGEEVLATGGDGFDVMVGGDSGTLVVSTIGQRSSATEIVDAPVTVTIEPGGRDDDENERIEATVFTIAPTGIATATTWEVDVYRHPPEVKAFNESTLFSFRSTIRGRVSPGTSVTVDGRPVELNANGAFRVEVDAPIWPREVVVVGRDPIGNEATQRLEVIGFVDYRGLPWIPIVGVLTVLAGIVLFVRTPNLRPSTRLAPDGDGRLEEIDGDLV